MHKKTATAILAFCLLATSILASCGDSEVSYLDEDGNIPSYALDEADDNIYILKKEDKRCYQGFTAGGVNMDDDTFTDLHFWLLESMEVAIPELTEDDQIIIKNVDERPNEFSFVELVDYGYTVGTNFTIFDNTSDAKSQIIISFGDETNPNSPVEDAISAAVSGDVNNENVKIMEINGQEMKASMLTDQGYLKGLSKDGMYKFSFYEGTYYKEVQIKADSHLYVAGNVYTSTAYAEMEDTYFVIAPSEDMENGYYYLQDYGMFFYSGAGKSIENNTEKEITTSTEDTSSLET